MKADVKMFGLRADPCPFCGGEWLLAVSELGRGHMAFATCNGCEAVLYGDIKISEVEAVASVITKVNSRAG